MSRFTGDFFQGRLFISYRFDCPSHNNQLYGSRYLTSAKTDLRTPTYQEALVDIMMQYPAEFFQIILRKGNAQLFRHTVAQGIRMPQSLAFDNFDGRFLNG